MESELSNNNTNMIPDLHTQSNAPDHGWQKVTYAKRQRKQKPSDPAVKSNGVNGSENPNVFRTLEQQSEDRRRRIVEAQRNAAAAESELEMRSKSRWEEEEGESDEVAEKEEEKKVKQKKVKKPKVTVGEAAAKIDSNHLAAFLADISANYEGQQEIQMMRFADYFGTAFSTVTSSQFPWVKLFRESSIAKTADIPLSHISDDVYKTSINWINQRSIEALGSFVIWCLDSIVADLASQQAASKGSKKVAHQPSSKSQVAIFVVLAMVLRRKPDALLSVLPTLRENQKYQGQEKLLVVAWMIAQVSQGDLAAGLYSWAHNLLPVVSGKSSNPQSRDIILQLVEKILSAPKARTILVNGAVRKGERLVPPPAFEILMRSTFPTSSARVKATERFEAVYPTLKEVVLAGSKGSKAMKQVSQQIFSFAIKAAGEKIPELSKEAAGVCIWCFAENADCYRQWDKIYQENLEASIVILKRISEDWKELSAKLAPLDPLRETLKNFRQKNQKGLASEDSVLHSSFVVADKHCKAVTSKLSHGYGCLKFIGTIGFIAVAAGAVIIGPKLESVDWQKLDLKKLEELMSKLLS